jgi:hypothetical protein
MYSRITQVSLKDYDIGIMSKAANSNGVMSCNWNVLCEQLMQQWVRLTRSELEATGHNRHRIALLIQRKYGITAEMADNYLCNFERTLPTLGCA